MPSGLISRWNQSHVTGTVQVGDEIMSVNNVVARPFFVRELNTDGKVKVELRKPILHTLNLNRGRNALGLTVSYQFITEIDSNGFFCAWLTAYATVVVSLGDFLLAVNGARGWLGIRTELQTA